jgi:ABC-type antimicrobial peptide transport system permease subunit
VDFVPEGYQLPRDQRPPRAVAAYISDGYFGTLNIPIQRGRGFLESDVKGAPLVAVVNEYAARHFWPKGDAIGKRLSANGDLVQIVGVARNAKYFWISEPPFACVYLPYRQHPRSTLTLVAEANVRDAGTLAPVLRDVVRRLDPDMPVFDVHTMQYVYTVRAISTPNELADIVAALGLMGLVLAVVGLYGLVAYSVSRRTREIGIRMAIGADRPKVIRMVLRQGLQLGGAGVAAGLVLSVIACSILTSRMWVATFDVNPLLYAAIALPLLGVTLLATWAPARRASRVDPMRALRDE